MIEISTKTDLYCVFGKPVSHSMGPLMHNTLFQTMQVNGVYLAFEINDIKKGVESIRELGIKGVSITIPFKEKILKYLDEIDETAMKIGAVNTIINRDGKLYGYNTDCAGAIIPLKNSGVIKDKNVFIIGAGGAARAVAFGIKKEQGKITIVNRTQTKAEKLAKEVDGDFLPLSDSKSGSKISQADIIINTTSVGMSPNIDRSPIDKNVLNNNMTIMDIVYNPLTTKLLKDAQDVGCKTIDGLAMFVTQGAQQFELFTGLQPSLDLMRQIIIKGINN